MALLYVTNRQLSDVNRDGALSLDEFCTAMHLVVLRRNDIELPDTLPPVLQPYTPLVSSGAQQISFRLREYDAVGYVYACTKADSFSC